MKLEVQQLWSTDVDPPVGGLPPDLVDFSVGVSLSIGQVDHPGGEVFYVVVESPGQLAHREPGEFVIHTLVLDRFCWAEIRKRIQKLLRHCELCPDWDAVVKILTPYLRHPA